MKAEIITPKGIEFSQEIKELILPTKKGEIAVLSHHVPLIAVLKSGIMTIITDDNRKISKDIEGGILEVGKTKTVVLLKDF